MPHQLLPWRHAVRQPMIRWCKVLTPCLCFLTWCLLQIGKASNRMQSTSLCHVCLLSASVMLMDLPASGCPLMSRHPEARLIDGQQAWRGSPIACSLQMLPKVSEQPLPVQALCAPYKVDWQVHLPLQILISIRMGGGVTPSSCPSLTPKWHAHADQ